MKHLHSDMMNIFVRVINPILMILFGLGSGIIVSRLRTVEWKFYGIGSLTFIASQILHIPFNTWILNPLLIPLNNNPQLTSYFTLFLAVTLGLSAGVFEETARYLVYRIWIKDARRWKDALMFGAGHGGIEAILLGLFTFLAVFQLISISDQDLTLIVPQEQLPLAQAQISAFWEAPWYAVLLGAGERLVAICFHIAASVLVLQVFRKRNIIWLFGAIGYHTLLNAIAVYGSQIWGIYLTEGILAIFGLSSIYLIYKFRTNDEPEDEWLVAFPVLSETQQAKLTVDQIEDSKYA